MELLSAIMKCFFSKISFKKSYAIAQSITEECINCSILNTAMSANVSLFTYRSITTPTKTVKYLQIFE